MGDQLNNVCGLDIYFFDYFCVWICCISCYLIQGSHWTRKAWRVREKYCGQGKVRKFYFPAKSQGKVRELFFKCRFPWKFAVILVDYRECWSLWYLPILTRTCDFSIVFYNSSIKDHTHIIEDIWNELFQGVTGICLICVHMI